MCAIPILTSECLCTNDNLTNLQVMLPTQQIQLLYNAACIDYIIVMLQPYMCYQPALNIIPGGNGATL